MAPTPSAIAPPAASGLAAGLPLAGVELRPLHCHRDARGSFTEYFVQSWGTGIAPVQWSVVQSQANVLRGLHYHRRHDEYFALISGRACVGLRDVREDSSTRDGWSLYELTASAPCCLIFPPGLLHGWYFHEDSVHLQAVSESHDDYGHDDNLGCHWSDPALEIPWPCTSPLLADRAARFPGLRELEIARRDRRS